jgi:hypothetical protein
MFTINFSNFNSLSTRIGVGGRVGGRVGGVVTRMLGLIFDPEFDFKQLPRFFVHSFFGCKVQSSVTANPQNKQETTTYRCNGFAVTDDCTLQPKKECTKNLGSCLKSNSGSNTRPNIRVPTPLPTKELKLEKMIVNMGPDGTRDDVHIKLCSQDGSMCCDSGELSHTFSREWVENKQETWDAGDFGKCKKQIIKVSTFPRVTLFKNKKDDMSVKSMELVMKNSKNAQEKTTFKCSGFSVIGDCSAKTNKECSKEITCV